MPARNATAVDSSAVAFIDLSVFILLARFYFAPRGRARFTNRLSFSALPAKFVEIPLNRWYC
jgi:hypothetical protein